MEGRGGAWRGWRGAKEHKSGMEPKSYSAHNLAAAGQSDVSSQSLGSGAIPTYSACVRRGQGCLARPAPLLHPPTASTENVHRVCPYLPLLFLLAGAGLGLLRLLGLVLRLGRGTSSMLGVVGAGRRNSCADGSISLLFRLR